jgi:hypothetical protein
MGRGNYGEQFFEEVPVEKLRWRCDQMFALNNRRSRPVRRLSVRRGLKKRSGWD